MPQIGKRKKLQIARRLPTIEETQEKDESCDYTQPIHHASPFEKCVDEHFVCTDATNNANVFSGRFVPGRFFPDYLFPEDCFPGR